MAEPRDTSVKDFVQSTTGNGSRVEVRGPVRPDYAAILTKDALEFAAKLERQHGSKRLQLLADREERQTRIDRGEFPKFLADTDHIRRGNWRVAVVPDDLKDRRVEITGPVDRKMIINALNSDANVFMADFEDSLSPTWDNIVQGQINLRDAVAGDISFFDAEAKKDYTLAEDRATLVVRPRGWHLSEEHVLVDDHPISAAIFDFGLYFYHNARTLLNHRTGPYFYLPKLEGHKEARLWAEVFQDAEETIGLSTGTVRATVLIETITAAFEMEEILYELRDYAVGLNCGRWDYIFSFIKKFRNHPNFVMPDRNEVTMTVPALRAYSQLLIKICHRRGAHAMGGMAAYIPVRTDPAANEAALDKVRKDKEREASDGHDGTWVAHPGLISLAKEIFDGHMPEANQLDRMRDDVSVTESDLLTAPQGTITEEGLRNNIRVGVQYIEAWLGGNGCVPLYNLMEDAATAEICRVQIWQWLKHGTHLEDGRLINEGMIGGMLEEEMARLRDVLGKERFESGHFGEAASIFMQVATPPDFVEFLTLPAYERIKSLAELT